MLWEMNSTRVDKKKIFDENTIDRLSIIRTNCWSLLFRPHLLMQVRFAMSEVGEFTSPSVGDLRHPFWASKENIKHPNKWTKTGLLEMWITRLSFIIINLLFSSTLDHIWLKANKQLFFLFASRVNPLHSNEKICVFFTENDSACSPVTLWLVHVIRRATRWGKRSGGRGRRP